MKKLIIPILLISSLVSCSKENNNPIASKSYPNEIGNYWVYLNYNSKSGSYDILTITVTGDTILDNRKPVKSLRYDYPNFSDRNFIYYSNDSVILFETDYHNSSMFGYIFPLEIGKAWAGFNTAMVWDSTKVTKKISIELFSNESYEGYEIIRTGWQFEGGYGQRVWFVPGIGEVMWFDSHIPSSLNHVERKLIKINFRPNILK